MQILDLSRDDADGIEQTAQVLVDAFRGTTDAWPDLETGRTEVLESFAPDRVSLVARDDDGRVIGWIGGIEDYDGHVWEVHPVAVSPPAQRRGVGRALLAALEARAQERGVLTLLLGTDDEVGRTSLGGAEMYPDLLGALAAIEDRGGHPFRFYQSCGFSLAGVVPDADGTGSLIS